MRLRRPRIDAGKNIAFVTIVVPDRGWETKTLYDLAYYGLAAYAARRFLLGEWLLTDQKRLIKTSVNWPELPHLTAELYFNENSGPLHWIGKKYFEDRELKNPPYDMHVHIDHQPISLEVTSKGPCLLELPRLLEAEAVS